VEEIMATTSNTKQPTHFDPTDPTGQAHDILVPANQSVVNASVESGIGDQAQAAIIGGDATGVGTIGQGEKASDTRGGAMGEGTVVSTTVGHKPDNQ
jgi:hypothetical protein